MAANGDVWIGGNGSTDSHILVFTRDGDYIRTIWQTNLFGRGSAEDIGGATHAALTRLIRELMNDDYFLIELQ